MSASFQTSLPRPILSIQQVSKTKLPDEVAKADTNPSGPIRLKANIPMPKKFADLQAIAEKAREINLRKSPFLMMRRYLGKALKDRNRTAKRL